MAKKPDTTVAANVATQIHVIRGQRVLLDSDLAALYGVTTKAFNQAVRRNIECNLRGQRRSLQGHNL